MRRTVSPVDVTAVRGSRLTYCVEVAAELLADVEEQTVRSVHQAQRPGRESPRGVGSVSVAAPSSYHERRNRLARTCGYLAYLPLDGIELSVGF